MSFGAGVVGDATDQPIRRAELRFSLGPDGQKIIWTRNPAQGPRIEYRLDLHCCVDVESEIMNKVLLDHVQREGRCRLPWNEALPEVRDPAFFRRRMEPCNGFRESRAL